MVGTGWSGGCSIEDIVWRGIKLSGRTMIATVGIEVALYGSFRNGRVAA